ncbi:hypothetical protein [Sphingomonas bacterium]|uniref:hypothetical protein n=1 Tax=Sphingomonas bacterium TaxID=1895847 RepID=UPI001575C0B4|nr:hypothetical protein [Sphingomonas bacterium]
MILPLLPAGLGALGPQPLPKGGCAAYLWSVPEPRALIATAAPASLRLRLDDKLVDLPSADASGAIVRGFARTTRYVAGPVVATVTMTVIERADIAGGALVADATLTVERAGGDAVVVPVGGLVGCG